MHVLLLNESRKAALVRSRRVLSKFLPQLGSSTWAGAISQEGLTDLRSALKSVGSKNTAVSCLRLEGRGRLVPQWVVGSKSAFDESGRFAFRQIKARPLQSSQQPAVKSPLEKYFSALLRLAALAHDTGKASQAFQDKLRRGHGAEAIRHELLSFLVLAESLWTDDVTDESWLARVHANPRALVACATRAEAPRELLPKTSTWLAPVLAALARMRSSYESVRSSEGAQETTSCLVAASDIHALLARAPGLCLTLWLVLTHHRLPDSDVTAQSWWAGDHIHVPRPDHDYCVAEVDACLVAAPGAAPWEDAGWCDAVSSAAGAARVALHELALFQPDLSSEFWAAVGAHYLRPALILSDHLGSQRAKPTLPAKTPESKKLIFANTCAGQLGDTLATHELAVARLTRKTTGLYSAQWPTTQLPAESLSVQRNLSGAYAWQLGLEDACKEAHAFGPTFLCIVAETGAGKTLGGLRAANALSGGALRLTLALGLRSLTKQTADSIRDDGLVPPQDMVVAVGHPQTLELELAERFKATEAARFGSESAEGEDAEVSLAPTGENDLSWLDGFCTEQEAPVLWGAKTLTLLDRPVLACTADHLVRSATMLRGGDAKLYLRLASSDLLLDEIDSYSSNDLQSIAKLAFISGLHGRNLIAMSATVSPAVQEGLYRSWVQGLITGARMRGQPARHASVFASNTVAPQVHRQENACLGPEAWIAYAEQVARAYAQRTTEAPRRKLEVAPLATTLSAEAAFETIVQSAVELHSHHGMVDPTSGVRVSTGFVRLNTAKHAWQLAKYLATRPAGEGPEIRFVSYHSKYPRTYLAVLDSVLGELTNRKNPEAFLRTPALRRALDESAGKDVLVLVCTTTLMETGRDFDFDWAVMEPRSVRGETQACGRVRRHRATSAVTTPNITLLERPLRALDAFAPKNSKGAASLWGMPGVEDEFSGLKLRVTAGFPAALSAVAPGQILTRSRGPAYVSLAADALPVSQWQKGLDAGLCIQPAADYASNRIGYLEQKAQALNLFGDATWAGRGRGFPPSVQFYLESLAPMNATHARKTPFRGARSSQVVFIPGAGKVSYFDEKSYQLERKAIRRPAPLVSWLDDVPAERALIPDVETQADSLYTGNDHHIDGCALRCAQEQGAGMRAAWHPLLGFLEG